MHGDFLAVDKSGKLTGGVSMLSGYIQKARSQEENVLYAISSDMFRGSIIDLLQLWKTIKTMDPQSGSAHRLTGGRIFFMRLRFA